MGDLARGHALHALVPAHDRADGREARCLPLVRRSASGGRDVLRLAAHSERARRVELPVGRTPRDVGSTRLHGVEPGEPGVHRRVRRRAHVMHPVGLHRLQRRSARRDDAAAPLERRPLREGDGAARVVRRHRHHPRLHDARTGAGILPHRPQPLRAPPRPRHGRPHAPRARRRRAASSSRITTSAASPSAFRRASPKSRRSSTSSACRSSRGTTRSRPVSSRWRRTSRTRTSPSTTTSS